MQFTREQLPDECLVKILAETQAVVAPRHLKWPHPTAIHGYLLRHAAMR
jgi:hypothetical protein